MAELTDTEVASVRALLATLSPEAIAAIPGALEVGNRTRAKDQTVALRAELAGMAAADIASRRETLQPLINQINDDEARNNGVLASLDAAITAMQAGQDPVVPDRATLLAQMGLTE